ncbi:hypothetical protein QYE76_034537, partial [Lolium multiflorum]
IMAFPSINFNQFLEKEKLKSNGSNFTDWFRHVRIFLNGGNLQYVLEAPLGSPPPPAVSEDVKCLRVSGDSLLSSSVCHLVQPRGELQKRFEHHEPCDMINELKVIFETHAAVESYEASKQFFGCMMEDGSSVSEHVFAMSGHAKKLSDLGIVIPNQLGIHRVLQSLPPSYKNFVMNYNMQNMNKELPELFSMLKSAEIEIQKEHQVLMVNKTTSFKKQGKPKKGNFKKGGKKAAAPPEKPKAGSKPDTECYYYNGKGHWKRNCPKYLADLKSGLVKKKKASRGGYRYVLTFTDDLRRYGYIYFMKHKSETFEEFKEFQSEVENQRNKKIKFLRSDRGGEYLSYEFGMHLKKCGILSQLTPPGTPQRNDVSERRNRTLLDMVRSMMSLTDLPLSFWGYALETAAFTLNRAPYKSVETTPYELWFQKKPKLSFLKVWGCEAYVKKSEGKNFVAKNGTFLEKEFLTKEVTGRKVELDEVTEPSLVDQSSAVPEDVPSPPAPITEEANDNDHETSNEVATEPRRSTRECTTPDWYDPCLSVMIVDNNDEDPATYEEAMMSPDSNKWQEAMKSEMGSMYDNKVWTLVDLPDSRKAVENKWIFKRKTDADAPCYLHSYIDPKDNLEKASHLLKDCRQFLEIQSFCDELRAEAAARTLSAEKRAAEYNHQPQHYVPEEGDVYVPTEVYLTPRGQVNMIHKTSFSKREAKKFSREVKYAEVAMAEVPGYIDWSDQSISFSKADHPTVVPRPSHAALVLEAQIGGYADKPPFKPLPPKEGNEEKEKKKKKGTKKKTKKKKKENKEKEVTAYPRVNEITLGNRKITRPRSIRIALELDRAGTGKEKTTSDRATKIAKNTEEMTIVNSGRSGDKLTQNMNRIRNIRASDNKINKTPNKMAITGGIRKRITISRTKLNIKLQSIDCALIPKSSTSKKILNVLFLRDRKAIRSRGNLNAKKIAKRTKISHKKLITKTSLDEGNILRIITSNDHIINIEKKKKSGGVPRAAQPERPARRVCSSEQTKTPNVLIESATAEDPGEPACDDPGTADVNWDPASSSGGSVANLATVGAMRTRAETRTARLLT